MAQLTWSWGALLLVGFWGCSSDANDSSGDHSGLGGSAGGSGGAGASAGTGSTGSGSTGSGGTGSGGSFASGGESTQTGGGLASGGVAGSETDPGGAGGGEATPCEDPGETLRPPFSESLASCERIVGDIHIPDLFELSWLAPLANVREIDGGLTVFRPHAAFDFRSLSALEKISGELSLRLSAEEGVSLEGLEGLREVGSLVLQSNPRLESLEPLEGLEVVHGDVILQENPLLSEAEVDDFFANTTVEGQIFYTPPGPQ